MSRVHKNNKQWWVYTNGLTWDILAGPYGKFPVLKIKACFFYIYTLNIPSPFSFVSFNCGCESLQCKIGLIFSYYM